MSAVVKKSPNVYFKAKEYSKSPPVGCIYRLVKMCSTVAKTNLLKKMIIRIAMKTPATAPCFK